jgi:hypothetical protein
MKKLLLLALCLLAISENAVAGKARRASRSKIAKSSRGGVAHQAKHEQPFSGAPPSIRGLVKKALSLPEGATIEGQLYKAKVLISQLNKIQSSQPSASTGRYIKIAHEIKEMLESFKKDALETDLSTLFANLNLGSENS